MTATLVLASGSATRAALLENVGVDIRVAPARIDEETIVASMSAAGAAADDVADALAEAKAARISARNPETIVLGCDQVLLLDGQVLRKAETSNEGRSQLRLLSGRSHQLFSAAVIYVDGRPQWRFTGRVQLTMKTLSDVYIDDYLRRNWDEVRHAVGCYHLEGEGARLFRRVEGDYFHVMGLPLLELLDHLTTSGVLAI